MTREKNILKDVVWRVTITMLRCEANKRKMREATFCRSAQIHCISIHIFIFMQHECIERYECTVNVLVNVSRIHCHNSFNLFLSLSLYYYIIRLCDYYEKLLRWLLRTSLRTYFYKNTVLLIYIINNEPKTKKTINVQSQKSNKKRCLYRLQILALR